MPRRRRVTVTPNRWGVGRVQLARGARHSRGRHRSDRASGAVPRSGFRPDVQGLRALAVALVVGYHLYPNVLPGGYVGVDVFFVISGFLITGHLTQKYLEHGRVRLLDFYGRRARRLLPAAVLVLVVTWVLSRLILPVTQQPAAATQVRASALYIQNWVLARDSVDYLQSQQAPSPVQHYWSLSVEEQFYLVWPLLFLAAAGAALVARRRWQAPERSARRLGVGVATGCAAAIVAGSLWYSVYETAGNPAAAYFITPTRLWELGLGGVLALLYPMITRWIGRVGWLAWLGLAMVVWSGVALSGASAFPGWVALVPTVGTALLITSGADSARMGTAALFARRPLVFIGDISYSLYLWHWPLIVLWQAYSGGSIGVLDGPVLVVASVLLAWLTKIFVEDRFRSARWLAARPGRSLVTATTAILPVAMASVFLAQQPAHPGIVQPDAQHPGAPALAAPADATSPVVPPASSAGSVPASAPSSLSPPPSPSLPSPSLPSPPDPAAAGRAAPSPAETSARASTPVSTDLSSVLPSAAQAPDDRAFANRDDCKANQTDTTFVSCVRGDKSDPELTVALVGDSYAGQWSSVLDRIAVKRHWKLVTVIHDGCPWTAVPVVRHGHTEPFTQCFDWGKQALNFLLRQVKPDVAIITARPMPTVPDHLAFDATSQQEIANGMVRYWRQLSAAGTYIVGIHPTPEPDVNIPDCLASRTGTVTECSVPRDKAVRTVHGTTPIGMAVDALGPGKATQIDLNGHICHPDVCPPVVGNVIVYRDGMHLTGTYSLTLERYLRRDLLQISALQEGPATSRSG